MNIDSSSIQSLLSSADGLLELQQTLQIDGELSPEFSDTLMEKIKQLNGLVEGDYLAEKRVTNTSGKTDMLHGIAGFLNKKGMETDSARLFGKGLPTINKFETNIDLENTLEALTSVINTLGDVDLDIKFEALLEKTELVKEALSEQFDLGENFEYISEELQKTKEINADQSDSVVVENTEAETEYSSAHVEESEEKLIDKDLPISIDIAERLDKVDVVIKQIKEIVAKEKDLSKETALDNQIENIATEVESIRNLLTQKNADKIIEKVDAVNDIHPLEATEEDDSLVIANQIAAIVATLNEPPVREKVTLVATLPELKPDQKTERHTLLPPKWSSSP